MLAQAQFQLEQQFAGLGEARRPHNHPVYVLEHGFGASTILKLREAASLLDRHWLMWTALAAEAGYRYEGEEYWPALERTLNASGTFCAPSLRLAVRT